MAVYAADLRVLDGAFGAVDDVTPQHLGQGAALWAKCRVHGRSLDHVYLIEEVRRTRQIRNRSAVRSNPLTGDERPRAPAGEFAILH